MSLEETQPKDLEQVSKALQEAARTMHPATVMYGVHIFLLACEVAGRISRADIYAGLLEICSYFEPSNLC
jgi:hypothetical protein